MKMGCYVFGGFGITCILRERVQMRARLVQRVLNFGLHPGKGPDIKSSLGINGHGVLTASFGESSRA